MILTVIVKAKNHKTPQAPKKKCCMMTKEKCKILWSGENNCSRSRWMLKDATFMTALQRRTTLSSKSMDFKILTLKPYLFRKLWTLERTSSKGLKQTIDFSKSKSGCTYKHLRICKEDSNKVFKKLIMQFWNQGKLQNSKDLKEGLVVQRTSKSLLHFENYFKLLNIPLQSL